MAPAQEMGGCARRWAKFQPIAGNAFGWRPATAVLGNGVTGTTIVVAEGKAPQWARAVPNAKNADNAVTSGSHT